MKGFKKATSENLVHIAKQDYSFKYVRRAP